MGNISRANLKKVIYYCRRNGLRKTWYAVLERLEEKSRLPYRWVPPSRAELETQRSRWEANGFPVSFSILVPAYRTKPEYLKEMIDSLCRQTYPGWELILADATEDDSVERVVRNRPDSRIRYIRLERNAGIAENTNQALSHVTGEYVGLLDHDDILAENALYEMAAAIEEGKARGACPRLLYSDEDKCSGDGTEHYEPNLKEDFNLDLLLSNNYICHFLVMDRELLRGLKLRQEFDGAQDYDLVLRAVRQLGAFGEPGAPGKFGIRPEDDGSIVHIPKVLYHWRCHTGSTAENPQSKRYAYEAGRRAVRDFVRSVGWQAEVLDTAHLGFYRLEYKGDIFRCRPDIGAVGGRITGRRQAERETAGRRREAGGSRTRRIIGGRMDENGKVFYENLPVRCSGYLHRALLAQNAAAVDLRNIRVHPRCRELFERITGVTYKETPETGRFDASLLSEDCDIAALSLELGRALRQEGYRILYLPEREVRT